MVSVLFFADGLEPEREPEPEPERDRGPAVQPAVIKPAAARRTPYLRRRLMAFGPNCRVVLTMRAGSGPICLGRSGLRSGARVAVPATPCAGRYGRGRLLALVPVLLRSVFGANRCEDGADAPSADFVRTVS